MQVFDNFSKTTYGQTHGKNIPKLLEGLIINTNIREDIYDMGDEEIRAKTCVVCSETIEAIKDTMTDKLTPLRQPLIDAFAEHPLCVKCSTEGYWKKAL